MALTDLIAIPGGINAGLHAARQVTMLALLGSPLANPGRDCKPVTDRLLRSLMVSDSVGPFRVTGLKPAVESLKEVLAEVRQSEPEVFAALGTAGMLCARLVRGSRTSISNHSWGTAIDINLNGQLDARGNGRAQVGLARIAPIFNAHKWFWGAGFPTEDAMHFEISDELIREWHAEGIFGREVAEAPEPVLSLGDRGRDVKLLQEKLNALMGAGLTADGIFGRGTQAAVIRFQAINGLVPDGIVGRKTREVLGM